MNQDILLSKIVPNSTETAWAQAYTTLNVYITLSIEKIDGKIPVTTYGKELLEKLQREFFALDEKTLDNIKKAVGNVSSTIEDGYNYSILVGAIVGDILYIVIASEGQVIIKRGDRIGTIATGVENELHGFSGKLKHDDVIIIETGGFAKKIPLDSIGEHLNASDVLQIAENITPIIHGESKGDEGAIILQFKDLTGIPQSDQEDFDIKASEPEAESTEQETDYSRENLWTKESPENNKIEELADEVEYEDHIQESNRKRLPSISLPSIPSINFASKKVIVIGIVVLLVALLVGGIFMQIKGADDAKRAGEFAKIYDPAKQRFDEGTNLEGLNKTLALEELNAALKLVNDALPQYPEGTIEHTKLTDLKTQIETKISELGGGGSAKNVKEFVKVGGEIKSITAITAKGGPLLILDKTGKQVVSIADDGSVDDTYDIDSEADYISADDRYIYAKGQTAISIDRGNGNVKEVADEVEGTSFDIFGSNFYTLNGDDVLKYVAPAYQGVSYFTEDVSFKSKASDIAISGPIYVLEDNGSIQRFTRGKKEDFEVEGLTAPIGAGSRIYAEPDLENIYVLDVKNQRVVVLDDEGGFITQYEGSFIKNSSGFAIDEENKIGYVLQNNIVYSFDL